MRLGMNKWSLSSSPMSSSIHIIDLSLVSLTMWKLQAFYIWVFRTTATTLPVKKNLPAMQVTLVWPPGQEDILKKETAIHSSIITWEISWTEEPGRLHSRCCKSWTRLGNIYLFFLKLYSFIPSPLLELDHISKDRNYNLLFFYL